MIPIKIKLVEDGQLPKKAHLSDACYDLYCRKIEHVGPGKVICHLGIKTEIPEGYKAIIVPRSSSSHKGWILANLTGVIDSKSNKYLFVTE